MTFHNASVTTSYVCSIVSHIDQLQSLSYTQFQPFPYFNFPIIRNSIFSLFGIRILPISFHEFASNPFRNHDFTQMLIRFRKQLYPSGNFSLLTKRPSHPWSSIDKNGILDTVWYWQKSYPIHGVGNFSPLYQGGEFCTSLKRSLGKSVEFFNSLEDFLA